MMEISNTTATAACPPYSSPPPSSICPLASSATVITSPCAACKILRRKCTNKCVLAPYFPPMDPLKFCSAHKVFGASNISKLLQELPEIHRADAVNSMVYEANARIRDPVYGCAGAICQLQEQVSQLQARLAKAKADLLNIQTQRANLVAIVCMETAHAQPHTLQDSAANPYMIHSNDDGFIEDSSNLGSAWESLWT